MAVPSGLSTSPGLHQVSTSPGLGFSLRLTDGTRPPGPPGIDHGMAVLGAVELYRGGMIRTGGVEDLATWKTGSVFIVIHVFLSPRPHETAIMGRPECLGVVAGAGCSHMALQHVLSRPNEVVQFEVLHPTSTNRFVDQEVRIHVFSCFSLILEREFTTSHQFQV